MSLNIEEILTKLTGCTTCRSKKVKCDRKRPICFRCQRLQLNCSWPSSMSLKERRRGYGTIRAREGTGWSPPQILPLTSRSLGSSIQVSNTVYPGQNEYRSIDHSRPVITDHEQRVIINSVEHIISQNLGQSSLRCRSDFAGQSNADTSNSLHAMNGLSSDSLSSSIPLYRNLTSFETALPSSLILTRREHNVLAEYQKGFLLVRATKSSVWCFHTILLRQGSRSPMVMHLLLAAALQELSNLQPDDSSFARAAQANFHSGAQILAKSANCEGFEAHLNFMTSLYMTYMYMAAQQRSEQRRTKELSKAVRDHVKKYNLLDFDGNVYFSSCTSKISENYRSLMAYMIMNLQDEDLLCGFQNGGGDLTNYLVSDENLHDIYLTSKLVLQNYWGVDYPQNEIVDDIENNVILEMRFRLNMLMHKINKLSLMSDAAAMCSKGVEIENEMTEFERCYIRIFQFVATPGDINSRFVHGANMLITHFYTLQIYLFRCQIGCSDIETPVNIQSAITNVLSTAHRAFKWVLASMCPRYHWALFMAGIEGKDPIHRDWCISHITDARVRKALEQVINVQEVLMGRMSVASIREEIARAPV